MKARITITLKPGVLDPQGCAAREAMRSRQRQACDACQVRSEIEDKSSPHVKCGNGRNRHCRVNLHDTQWWRDHWGKFAERNRHASFEHSHAVGVCRRR